jgi:hypothetical protein
MSAEYRRLEVIIGRTHRPSWLTEKLRIIEKEMVPGAYEAFTTSSYHQGVSGCRRSGAGTGTGTKGIGTPRRRQTGSAIERAAVYTNTDRQADRP